jgi:tRNA pseudouridine32 synthase / 23S rRNA pseudouridine746 synthase
MSSDQAVTDWAATYWYEGMCPQTGQRLRLPRSVESEVAARSLWESFDADWPTEGKMYGVLIAETVAGDRQILKAYSGLINGDAALPGWAPPLPGREGFARSEVETLIALETRKQELIQLKSLPIYQAHQDLETLCKQELTALDQLHAERKNERDRQRQTELTAQQISDLEYQSRQDGADRRRLKKQHKARLAPLIQQITEAEHRIQVIKQERKELSRQLQLQMHQAYQLTNFLGLSASLRELMPQGAPTGTGECCAPKLLHQAAVLGLKPIAMAEFWWGEAKSGKQPGQFYGACESRCQPIMGFLLAGTQPRSIDLVILYEDEYLIAIDKPSGLLSVPGRGSDLADSALLRLRNVYPDVESVHRLDQDTSGVLLFAKNLEMQRKMQRCFEERKTRKTYIAVVAGNVQQDAGTIDLPLWGNPDLRPKQVVDEVRGKPAVTEFQVVERSDGRSRIIFQPITGRTHQLRVHAAIGLGCPIVGDRLYGWPPNPQSWGDLDKMRLHLHAQQLEFAHPIGGEWVSIGAKVPF